MKRIYLIVLMVLLLFMAACNAAGSASNDSVTGMEPEATAVPPTIAVPTDTPASETAVCPPATDEMALLQNPANGYCLLYPADYQVVETAESAINIVKDSLLNTSDPRFGLTVEAANGRTASQMAEAEIANFPTDQWPDVQRSTITLDGVTAEMVDNLPGQDLHRRLFLVHEDRLYQMFFSPVDKPDQMQPFFDNLIASFHFVPVVAAAPLQAGPECPEATAVTQLYRSQADGYCLLIPADFTAEETAPGNSVIYFGSLMDVEHPKLFINVAEADGRPIYEVAEEMAANWEGFEIERTFGLLVDGEPAEMLGKLPGQDLNRQLIVIHDGRLYTLTFVPDDAATGTVYEQMEEMYKLTLNSFNFLQ
ncbi:MAG: hypothetical protein H6658_10375 [Ardenticatenaceae bacterium]|nr:hypothetical protein [Ardenticatenaceae bacterium]